MVADARARLAGAGGGGWEVSKRLTDAAHTARRRGEGRHACMEGSEALQASDKCAADEDGGSDGEHEEEDGGVAGEESNAEVSEDGGAQTHVTPPIFLETGPWFVWIFRMRATRTTAFTHVGLLPPMHGKNTCLYFLLSLPSTKKKLLVHEIPTSVREEEKCAISYRDTVPPGWIKARR